MWGCHCAELKHSPAGSWRSGSMAPRILDPGTRHRAWSASSDYLLVRGGEVITSWIESRADTWASPVALPLPGLEPGTLRRRVSNLVTLLTRLTCLFLRWALIRVRPVRTLRTYLQNHTKKIKRKCKLQMSRENNKRDQQHVSRDVIPNAAGNTRQQEQILGQQILSLCCLCLLLPSIAQSDLCFGTVSTSLYCEFGKFLRRWHDD
jgi:hypothetical protein